MNVACVLKADEGQQMTAPFEARSYCSLKADLTERAFERVNFAAAATIASAKVK